MSLVSLSVMFAAEFVLWVMVNRSTPFSEKSRLTILKEVTGSAAFFAGLYAALCFGIGVYVGDGSAFLQITVINPIDALVFSLVNSAPWAVIALRQHSMSYQH